MIKNKILMALINLKTFFFRSNKKKEQQKNKCLHFMLFKWEWFIFFPNSRISFYKPKAKMQKIVIWCLLVVSYEINNLKIKKNNHFYIHSLCVFDIRNKCIIIVDVSNKIYNDLHPHVTWFHISYANLKFV